MATNMLNEMPDPLTNLMPSNPGQTKYYCGRCEGWYLDEETLIEHINLYHEYWCTICNLRLRSENQLKQHMINVHCVNNRCESCRIIFNNSPEITLKHMLEKHCEIRDKHAFMNNHAQENRVSTPVPRQSSHQNTANNSRYHATLNHSSEYLCAKCNLKFTNIQETAKHMMSRHQVEIGIRTYKDSGKEEIFIINNKGKIFTLPAKNQEHSIAKKVTFDGGKTTLTITNTGRSNTSNGNHLAPPSISISPNLPNASSFRPSSSNNVTQEPQLRRVVPRSQVYASPLINNNNQASTRASPPQNGFLPNYASTPELLPNTNSKQNHLLKARQCKHCNRQLSSNYSLNRHIRTVHKSLTQNSQSTLKIDRILSQSEIEPFETQNTSLQDKEPLLQSPISQVLSNSETDSLPSVHVEVESEDEIEVINQSSAANDPPNTIDDMEEQQPVQEIDSDSDMEITVISEPEPSVPKPKPFVRVQPSHRFLQSLSKKSRANNTGVSKRDLADKMKKIASHLSLKNKIMPR